MAVVLFLAWLVVFPILFITYFRRYRRLKKKYSPIVNVEAEAERMRHQAESLLQQATANSDAASSEGIIYIAKAKEEAQQIIERANQSAEAIAGEALEAKDKLKEYELAAKAFKNIIEGYGDEYIIPSQNLLDDLAAEYSFTDAGKDLKVARAKSRDMVGDGDAAACDYAEESRKRTAMAFVVDAFNGKVDSILSRTKRDNFGTLSQEIQDARVAVNENGRAFRNARITEGYMNARIEELRLGCIAFELREQDKAQQREIKEKIREEEKARREQEKALREATKQEDAIRKAMEDAKAHIESANAAERAKFEAKLAELEWKLAEAEAKAQRAKSMAEMTKSGHVYIISNIGSFGDDILKIGMTRRLDPMDRVWELSDASVPFDFDVHAMIYCEDAPRLESDLHRKFNETRLNKVNFRKEFFRVGISDIKKEIDALGIETAFTMRAEALEYRETLAIGKLAATEREKLMKTLIKAEEREKSEDEQKLVEAVSV